MKILRSILFISSFSVFASGAFAQQSAEVVVASNEEGPTILFDGKKISENELANMDQSLIGDIKILSGAEAKDKFGKYEEFGAIVITSPKPVEETITTIPSPPSEYDKSAAKEGETVRASFDADFAGHVIIDGKPSTVDALRAMDMNKIKQISTYYGSEATALFGDVAKNGVLVVELH